MTYAIAFIFGILGGFAFAPWNIALAMPLSLGVMLFLLERAVAANAARRRAFAIGWWWGLGNFLVGQFWIAEAFNFQAKMPAALGWLAVIMLSAIMGLYPGVSAAVASRFKRGPIARTLAFAGMWMLAEWLRGYLFSGFGWNPLGIVSLPLGELAQIAALIGALGLSGIIALASYGLAHLALRRVHLAAALIIPVIIAAFAPIPFMQPTAYTDTRLDIIQANIGQDEKYGPGAIEGAIRRYSALSPPPSGTPRLLIWPEAAIPDVIDELPGLRARLAGHLLGPDDVFILGGLKALRGPDGRTIAAHNSLFVLGPEGGIRDRYDKTVLVPYGEYLPARPLLEAIGLARLAPGALDFVPGTGPHTLNLPGFPNVGAMICYEAVYPEAASSSPRPRWLLNLSNDAWFTDEGAEMHLAHARLRAIEQGLPVARSTPTGISAVIDPWGRVTAALGRGTAGRVIAQLPAPRAPTLFARTGTALPHGIALMLILAAFILSARQGRT
ncbi:apolipoprotein N-acyltransferase [Pacificimonas sp. WHA3]|uniref:Apolipoprotein N-acyltransferase n=1 Tax=Pacificimonas pallii TaxID=2827236 RepID=A0ABS6SC32_9SPHN|nr:apolipoprotein N-acyltransferase [Pacificimonas pallii]MBV7255982.1 apolipoprotein N-acyltransferase [Pacificimonas pallii]